MRLRGVLIAVLSVAACARQITAIGHSRYAPKWRVGDWWIVRTWQEQPGSLRREWGWDYMRYDVARIENVGQHDCYVVEMRSGLGTNISSSGPPGRALYVRTDNWLVVREVKATFHGGKRLSPRVSNYPRGLFGPFISEPRLPRFPLQLVNKDTTFERQRRDDCYADLREVSNTADPSMVKRLLSEGDSAGGRVISPTGTVFEVRSELAGEHDPGSPAGRKDIVQSLQLWSDDVPWRVFEERVGYNGSYGGRNVEERSWLVAVGHKGK